MIPHLGSSKEEFLIKYNPSVGEALLDKSYTPGRVALLPNVPTLCDVKNMWGRDLLVNWIEILLTKIEDDQGSTSVFSPTAKKDTAAILASYYRDMNIAEFLLFRLWYKLDKFGEIYSGGLERVMRAFAIYRKQRDEELERIEREQEYERMELERKRWQENAISYEEYLRTKDHEREDLPRGA